MKTLEVLDRVLKGKRVRPNTQRHYRESLTSLGKYSEDWPVSGVVINEWLNSLTDKADATVKMWFDFVNSAGRYMERAYKVANPCKEAETSRARRIIKRAGLTGSKLGPHTLRHSGGSLVALATGSALAVKAHLQHDDIKTSMVYIHDVESEIAQRISPLRLVLEKAGIVQDVIPEARQIELTGSGDGSGRVVDGEAVWCWL